MRQGQCNRLNDRTLWKTFKDFVYLLKCTIVKMQNVTEVEKWGFQGSLSFCRFKSSYHKVTWQVSIHYPHSLGV